MSKIVISKKNEVFLKIEADPHVYHELSDQFTFDVEGAKFMPQYRKILGWKDSPLQHADW